MQELDTQLKALKDDVAVVRMNMNGLLAEIEEIKGMVQQMHDLLAGIKPAVDRNTQHRKAPWYKRLA